MSQSHFYSREMTETARALRQAATPAESRLWELIRGRRCGGWRFCRQVPAGQYILDFYCAAARLVIEVDGSIHSLPEVQGHDAAREQVLEAELKMTVYRLTNERVLTASPGALHEEILQALEYAVAQMPPPGERIARRL